jgi:hypothetical protein
MSVSNQVKKNGNQLQKEIHSSFSCFDITRRSIMYKIRMVTEGQAIKTVFITMLFSLDWFIPAKILGAQPFVIIVYSADSCSMAFSCVWLHSLI